MYSLLSPRPKKCPKSHCPVCHDNSKTLNDRDIKFKTYVIDISKNIVFYGYQEIPLKERSNLRFLLLVNFENYKKEKIKKNLKKSEVKSCRFEPKPCSNITLKSYNKLISFF